MAGQDSSFYNLICRACLAAKRDMICLFIPFNGSLTLSDMIQCSTALQVGSKMFIL